MMILLLHTVAAFSPAAPAHRRVHPCTRATCSRQRVCGALLASGGGDAGNDLGAYWDKATGFMRAFRVPRLKDDDLPEAAALSAQIELVAVKFSGVCSTTAQTTACFRMTRGCLPPAAAWLSHQSGDNILTRGMPQKNPAGRSLQPLTPLTLRR